MTVVAIVGLGYVGLPLVVKKACRVIENTQRDLNIALMNALAIIFGRVGIDTAELLEAAGTKWNFLGFRPGLVEELTSYGVEVSVHDPQASAVEALEEHGSALCEWSDLPRADAVIAAVAHHEYQQLTPAQIADKVVPGGCFIDVKSRFDAVALRRAGLSVRRL
jgi:UDP-N-acetyl-D-mannosaminuronate dehydrogenase